MQPVPWDRLLQFLTREGTALVIGGVIGLERQWRQRMAGTRTNALVAAAAAAFVLAGNAFTNDPSGVGRMAAQVISGIGFLGAGVIFKEGITVHGLNTAATIWTSAAVGVLCGIGLLWEGLLTGILVLFANVLLRPLTYKFHPHLPPSAEQALTYRIAFTCDAQDEPQLRQQLLASFEGTQLTVFGLQTEEIDDLSKIRVSATVRTIGRHDDMLDQLTTKLYKQFRVSEGGWTATAQSIE